MGVETVWYQNKVLEEVKEMSLKQHTKLFTFQSDVSDAVDATKS